MNQSKIHSNSEDTDNILFHNSLDYLEKLHHKLRASQLSREDFEQLNAVFEFNNLAKNIELSQIHENIKANLPRDFNQKWAKELESDLNDIINQYIVHKQCVFIVDKVAHLNLSSGVKQALAVFHLVQKKKIVPHHFKTCSQLTHILTKDIPSDSIIDSWYFNSNFFTIDFSIFDYLGVKFDVIKTSDKNFCVKSINFLEEVGQYRKGEAVNKIASEWKSTIKGSKRWHGIFLENLIIGEKDKSSHGFDWISENEVIYQNSSGIGLSGFSETFLFKKDTHGNWQKIKQLQKLLR